ncbi:hypothetical protein [Streptomyces sp. NPDC001056]
MEIAGHRLPEGSWWDWEVTAWDAGALRLAAGSDLTYHHALEVVFVAPALVSCPLAFQDPVFRAPTPDETARLARSLGEASPVLVAFEAHAGGIEPVSCLVAAERVEFRHGLVRRSAKAPDQEASRPPSRSTPCWPGVPLPTD